MERHVLPLLFTLLLWWFSTGVILYLDGLPRRTFKWTMLGATLLLFAALAGLAASSASTSVASAYCAFTCAVAVWAWQEVAFLLGYVTGPRRTAATPGLAGWARTREALGTVIHHEIALLVLGAAVLAATWGQPNQTGFWTFAVLWAMRQSAKLNVFLGVRNLYESFLPAHLRYLHSYFRREPMNPLFPVSVIVSTAVAVPLWHAAFAPAASAATATSLSLVGSLLALAILEHWFLVLPLPSENLWKWAMRSPPTDR
ncbi:putative photosynthetic complex assembly protein PuhE [Ramlibacter sp.]|uniref:putative photosynthetic complex assembly protein PuhE n=1 Tax=Ramlibacter sp. TaxID=1917967 RepID=UPI003D0AD373